MKKVFVYLTIFILIFVIQACNPTSTDSKESKSTENTKKKNVFSIAASEVPSSVINTFNGKYPKAVNVTWEKATEDGKPSYKAKWKIDGKKIKAEFSEDGSFIKEKESD
jgi:curli biogenesis system outer membrane secretion channel CsgG